MADPTFSPPARSNLALPIVLAVGLLACAIYLVIRYTPHTTATLSITHTNTWQAHTVFKSDTIIVGHDKAEDDLYVLATLHIDNHLRLPLFVKELTATVTTSNGQLFATSAAEKPVLNPLYTTFPALKPLASPPLLRDTTIAAGQSTEGMVLLHFPFTQEAWDHRKAATLTVDFYHQPPQSTPIP